MEEDKKQIITPLSEYRKMEKKISDLTRMNKRREETSLNGKECRWGKIYKKHIGNNEYVNVPHILNFHNSLTVRNKVKSRRAREQRFKGK